MDLHDLDLPSSNCVCDERSIKAFQPPKELIILAGSAHADFLFQTDQGERVMREILGFLSAP
jgi:hypothetical protein